MRKLCRFLPPPALLAALAASAARAQDAANADDLRRRRRQRLLGRAAHRGLHRADRGAKDQPQGWPRAWSIAARPTSTSTGCRLPSPISIAPSRSTRKTRARSANARTSFASAGRIDSALADANEAVRLDPERRQGLRLSRQCVQQQPAIRSRHRGLRRGDPARSEIRAGLACDRGATYYFKSDYDARSRITTRRSGSIPRTPRAFTNRGAAYKKMGHNDTRSPTRARRSSSIRTVPEYFDNRGLSYEANGDYDRAIADYNEAIRLAPQANFLTNRGDAYNQKGDYDRAIADYDRALKLNPGFYLAYNNRGAAFRREGRSRPRHRRLRAGAAHRSAVGLRRRESRRGSPGARPARHACPSGCCRPSIATPPGRAVEKAICSDPDLSRLDRQIDDAYKAALAQLDRKDVAHLREEQRDFIGTRNKRSGGRNTISSARWSGASPRCAVWQRATERRHFRRAVDFVACRIAGRGRGAGWAIAYAGVPVRWGQCHETHVAACALRVAAWYQPAPRRNGRSGR